MLSILCSHILSNTLHATVYNTWAKVLNSCNGLQLNSGHWCWHHSTGLMISYYCYTVNAFICNLYFSRYHDLFIIMQKCHTARTGPLWRQSLMLKPIIIAFNLYIKSKVQGPKLKNMSHYPDHALFMHVRHSWASTGHVQPTHYQEDSKKHRRTDTGPLHLPC